MKETSDFKLFEVDHQRNERNGRTGKDGEQKVVSIKDSLAQEVGKTRGQGVHLVKH